MDLDLTEEQKLIQDTAREFAAEHLAPLAAKLDQEGDRPAFLANLKKLAELGFMGLNVSDAYGGAEAGVVAFSLAMTEIARACASTVAEPRGSGTCAEVGRTMQRLWRSAPGRGALLHDLRDDGRMIG